jgi:hypothetical protein
VGHAFISAHVGWRRGSCGRGGRQLFQPVLAGERVAVAVGGGRVVISAHVGWVAWQWGEGNYFGRCWLGKGWCGVSDVQ